MLTDWAAPTYTVYPHKDMPRLRARVVFRVEHKTDPGLGFDYEEPTVFDLTEDGLKLLIFQQLEQRDRIIDGIKAVPSAGTLDLTALFPKPKSDPTPDDIAVEAFRLRVFDLIKVKAVLLGGLDPTCTRATYTAAFDVVKQIYAAASPKARADMQAIWATQYLAALLPG